MTVTGGWWGRALGTTAAHISQPAVMERYSGHESFTCRYGWLTKVYQLIDERADAFRDLNDIIVALGIGKNMAKSLRFWAGAFDLVEDTAAKSLTITPFGRWLLDPGRGADPYLEDQNSLWLLHWRLVSTAQLAVWNLLFFDTPDAEVTRRRLHERLNQRAAYIGKDLAPNTLKQHVDVFLSSYIQRDALKNQAVEDTLACPLQELGLMRLRASSTTDEIIEFYRSDRPYLDDLTFGRLTTDYWKLRAENDRTLSLGSLLLDYASPGLILRMDEDALTMRLERLCAAFPKVFRYSRGIERQSLELIAKDLSTAKAALGYI